MQCILYMKENLMMVISMTEKQYRLNKWGTKLLKNNRPLFDWANESDDIVDLLNEQGEEIKSLKLENQLLLEEMKEIRDKLSIYLEIKGVDIDD